MPAPIFERDPSTDDRIAAERAAANSAAAAAQVNSQMCCQPWRVFTPDQGPRSEQRVLDCETALVITDRLPHVTHHSASQYDTGALTYPLRFCVHSRPEQSRTGQRIVVA